MMTNEEALALIKQKMMENKDLLLTNYKEALKKFKKELVNQSIEFQFRKKPNSDVYVLKIKRYDFYATQEWVFYFEDKDYVRTDLNKSNEKRYSDEANRIFDEIGLMMGIAFSKSSKKDLYINFKDIQFVEMYRGTWEEFLKGSEHVQVVMGEERILFTEKAETLEKIEKRKEIDKLIEDFDAGRLGEGYVLTNKRRLEIVAPSFPVLQRLRIIKGGKLQISMYISEEGEVDLGIYNMDGELLEETELTGKVTVEDMYEEIQKRASRYRLMEVVEDYDYEKLLYDLRDIGEDNLKFVFNEISKVMKYKKGDLVNEILSERPYLRRDYQFKFEVQQKYSVYSYKFEGKKYDMRLANGEVTVYLIEDRENNLYSVSSVVPNDTNAHDAAVKKLRNECFEKMN